MILSIDAPTFGPSGVGRRDDGKVVLVHGAYPGDVVQIEMTQEYSGYCEAGIVKLLSPSQHRTTPTCVMHPQCGGCAWMGMNLEAQRHFKKELVARCVRHISNAENLLTNVIHGGSDLSYRQRCRLAIEAQPRVPAAIPAGTEPENFGTVEQKNRGTENRGTENRGTEPGNRAENRGTEPASYALYPEENGQNKRHTDQDRDGFVIRLGFFKHGTHHVVPISWCAVCMPELNQTIALLDGWPMQRGMEGSVELTRDSSGAVMGAFFLGKPYARAQQFAQALVDEKVLAGCIVKAPGSRPGSAGKLLGYHTVLAKEQIEVPVTPMAFSQANPEVNELLVKDVLAAVSASNTKVPVGAEIRRRKQHESVQQAGQPTPNTHILELYAGHGNFTRPLLAAGHKITAVELGVDLGLIESHPNLWFLKGDAQATMRRLLKKRDFKPDVVLLDPPRTGAKEVVPLIAQMSPRTVVYVSCDPNTFARDAAILQKSGYHLTTISAFDMMPHTWHIELLAVFQK